MGIFNSIILNMNKNTEASNPNDIKLHKCTNNATQTRVLRMGSRLGYEDVPNRVLGVGG